MEEFSLYGNKSELIEILESHIAYLKASGYDQHVELDYCYNFLMQLDDSSDFLKSKYIEDGTDFER